MKLIVIEVFGNLGAIYERTEPFNMQIFQIMGALVCSKDISDQDRLEYTENCINQAYKEILKSKGNDKR